MQNGYPVAETGHEALDGLGRKGDFGHHDYRAASTVQFRRDGLQVHFRLARARDTVQQDGSGIVRKDRTECRGLFGVQGEGVRGKDASATERVAALLPRGYRREAGRGQVPQTRGRRLEFRAERS